LAGKAAGDSISSVVPNLYNEASGRLLEACAPWIQKEAKGLPAGEHPVTHPR
jgi:hypothetical protein